MNNYREIIRRLIKYILNCFIVFIAAQSIFKGDIQNSILIAVVSSSAFAVIDIVAPTISILN
jgi:hypothetical protein